jgi:hypothetical protein
MPKALMTSMGPGRVRFRIPIKRGDAIYFNRIRSELESLPEVIAIRVNPLSASVLILHHGDFDLGQLVQWARSRRLFSVPRQPDRRLTLGEMMWHKTKQVESALETLTRGRIDLETSFFFLFLVLGLSQVWRGQIMQPAIPLLWRAMDLLRKSQENQVDS